MIDIRIIGTQDDISRAEAALRDRFTVHSAKHYPSRHGDLKRSYLSVELKAGGPAVVEIPKDIEDLRIKLHDIGDVNNVLFFYNFRTNSYIGYNIASELNNYIQNAIRDIVPDVHDPGINGRLDQTFRDVEGSHVLYHSGSDWRLIY